MKNTHPQGFFLIVAVIAMVLALLIYAAADFVHESTGGERSGHVAQVAFGAFFVWLAMAAVLWGLS